MVEAIDKLRSNASTFQSFYRWNQIAWFFDFFQKKRNINEYLNYNTLKIQFHDNVFDNDILYNHFSEVYWKEPNNLKNNYTGFILIAWYKLFFTLIKEIIDETEFRDFLINSFWKENTEKLTILYSFLRNFWSHNIEPEFLIQEYDYNGTLSYMTKKSTFCKTGELNLKFTYQQIININVYINFNEIKWKNIFDIIDMKLHLSTLNIFYNICSMFKDHIKSN